jgi:DNA polymerase-3 subunit epsilon
MRALAAAGTRAPGADLGQASFVVVDVETTGWRPGQAALTEIGAVRLSGGKLTAEFSALVNPGMPIPPRITELTGITDDMVRDVPAAGDVLPLFLEFAAGAILTAHNAPFDTAFLADACHRNGLTWHPGPVVDTAVLARIVLRRGEVADRRLATLATHFGTGTTPNHRALADARATAEVLSCLITLLAERGQAMRYPRAARGLLRASARATLGRLLQPRRAPAGTLLGGQPSGDAGARR